MSDIGSEIEQLLRDIHYGLVRLTRSTLHETGLTPPRFHTLWLVVSFGPLSMSEVHKKLHVSKSSVTALVDGLVADGLIDRRRADTDRRKVMLSATATGCGVLEEIRKHRSDLVDWALENASAEERMRLKRTLDSLKRRLSEKEA